jgi:hypothetical protein
MHTCEEIGIQNKRPDQMARARNDEWDDGFQVLTR